MDVADRAVATARRYALEPLARRWSALETDYKSIACACAILVSVVGFGLHIPW